MARDRISSADAYRPVFFADMFSGNEQVAIIRGHEQAGIFCGHEQVAIIRGRAQAGVVVNLGLLRIVCQHISLAVENFGEKFRRAVDAAVGDGGVCAAELQVGHALRDAAERQRLDYIGGRTVFRLIIFMQRADAEILRILKAEPR